MQYHQSWLDFMHWFDEHAQKYPYPYHYELSTKFNMLIFLKTIKDVLISTQVDPHCDLPSTWGIKEWIYLHITSIAMHKGQ